MVLEMRCNFGSHSFPRRRDLSTFLRPCFARVDVHDRLAPLCGQKSSNSRTRSISGQRGLNYIGQSMSETELTEPAHPSLACTRHRSAWLSNREGGRNQRKLEKRCQKKQDKNSHMSHITLFTSSSESPASFARNPTPHHRSTTFRPDRLAARCNTVRHKRRHPCTVRS